VVPPPGRPPADTTRHLEGSPGWLLGFRNLQTALYLRGDAGGRANLERLSAWYAAQRVPFDPERGFEPERVIREAPAWAVAHGVVPADFAALEAAAQGGPLDVRRAAQDRIASLYLLLGLYERAERLDERLLATDPRAILAARRTVWSRLHRGRVEEAVAAAERLQGLAPEADALSHRIAAAARRAAELSDAERREMLASLPVFTRPQGQWVTAGFVPAEARPGREP
jgi:tetratricopeptide (TPR) repeat protein